MGTNMARICNDMRLEPWERLLAAVVLQAIHDARRPQHCPPRRVNQVKSEAQEFLEWMGLQGARDG